jgi:hypothetical protein
MDVWEMGLEDVDWMHMAYVKEQCQALVNTVVNLQIP